MLCSPGLAPAQTALSGSPGQLLASPSNAIAGGVVVVQVAVTLQGTTGSPEGDAAVRTAALEAADLQVGQMADTSALMVAAQRIRKVDGVTAAAYEVKVGPAGGSVTFLVSVGESGAAREPTALPKLYEDSRSLLKLIFNGGVGVYSDGNAFFRNWTAFNAGSPIAPGPPTGRRTTFMDISLEPGLGGITQIGVDPLYLYGAATVVASDTLGADIYQRNEKMYVAVEKAYAGLLWVPEKGQSVNVSLGRQNYTLNDGFLIHQVKGSTNVGNRRATFLGARTANDFAGLLNARSGQWQLQAFYLDPNEYEPIESNTRFAGGNARYAFGEGLVADATFVEIVNSDTVNRTPQGTGVPRQGVQALAGHLRWRNALGISDFQLEGEFGHQTSTKADISAYAGYASAGYRFSDTAWRPAIVLRYAEWTGDRPGTARYERWDPLLPAGSDEWMGGMIFSKYVANSNLHQFRFRYFAEPSETFNFTVDWLKYRADQTNNLGATPVLSTLASRDLGDEVMFIGRQYLGKNYYLQTLASINWPGAAIRSALPQPAKTWTSLQATLYWFF